MPFVQLKVNGIETILRIDFSSVESWQLGLKKIGVGDVD